METQFWSKVKEFHGAQLLRNPETFECRILPVEKPQPQQAPEPVISPARQAWIDGAYARYLAEQVAKATPAAIQPQPMSFEEQLSYDWRFNPGIRKEFVSYDSFLAFKRAEKAGRTKVCGRG